MKIKKVNLTDQLRIRIADGETDGKPFVVGVLASGDEMGVVVEFDDETYLAPTEEIIKEIIKFRGKNAES